jgi:hypothetical protein
MALTLTLLQLPSGLEIPNAYGLITEFRLLNDRRLEIVISYWKDAEACGQGKERLGSNVFHVGSENEAYQELFSVVTLAAYNYLKEELGSADYEGDTVYPGSLIVAQDLS